MVSSSAKVDFSEKATDLDALRTAVVEATTVGTALWLSYLFVLLYLLIAVGSVSHRDLFLESTVKLPFLGVELPLVGFFLFGPALLLVFHTYVLVHFVLLASKILEFNTQLDLQIPHALSRASLRRQLPSNIFVQVLAGPAEVRTGILGFLLRGILWVSLLLGPVALFVFFQLQFLPYHSGAITWWHRLAVLADVALLWTLWPSIAYGLSIRDAWGRVRRSTIAMMMMFLSIALALVVVLVTTFPGELTHKVPSLRFIPWASNSQGDESRQQTIHWKSLHEILVGGNVDLVAQRQTSIWSNRIVVPGIDVVDRAKHGDDTKIASLPETVSLRGRNLEGAVLSGAHLRKADFRAAKLGGAFFVGADLRDSKIGCMLAEPEERTSFILFRALKMQCAEMQGAVLDDANLQGLDASGAHLQGASLRGAKLQGAVLNGAMLHGANFELAQLQAASLRSAYLQFARFWRASMQGVDLDNANMRGSVLSSVQLQGASLKNTNLKDATISIEQVPFSSGRPAFVWRSDPREAMIEGILVVGVEKGEKELCSVSSSCTYTFESFVDLKQMIETSVADEQLRKAALARIAVTLNSQIAFPEEKEIADAWSSMEKASSAKDFLVRRRLSDDAIADWIAISCDRNGAPYAARRLLQNIFYLDSRLVDRRQKQTIALNLLDEKKCPGAANLTDSQRATLIGFRDKLD